MKFNYCKLLGLMKELRITQTALAYFIMIDPKTLNAKLNNRKGFRQWEIVAICKCLRIPISDIPKYFFTLEE